MNNNGFTNDAQLVNDYDVNGNLIATHDQLVMQINITHDEFQSQEVISMNNTDFHAQTNSVTYKYNAMGQLIGIETQENLTGTPNQPMGQFGFFSSNTNASSDTDVSNALQHNNGGHL
jgi:YD repeat-containing protein